MRTAIAVPSPRRELFQGVVTMIDAAVQVPQPGPLISLEVNIGSNVCSVSVAPPDDTVIWIFFG